MKCPKCNNEVEEGKKYCPFCGNNLTIDIKDNNADCKVNVDNKTSRRLIIYFVSIIMIIVTSSIAIYFTVAYKRYHTITFDACGGICESTSIKYLGDEKKINFPYPERAGYVFFGWYANKKSSGSKITENYFLENIHSFGDTTFYAHWGKPTILPITNSNYSKYIRMHLTELQGYNSLTVRVGFSYLVDYLTYAERRYRVTQLSVTVVCKGVSQTRSMNEAGGLTFTFSGNYLSGARITNVSGKVECILEVYD